MALGPLAAWPLGTVACTAFGRLMLGPDARLQFALSPAGLAAAALTSAVFAWMASQWPARRAMRLPVAQALAGA